MKGVVASLVDLNRNNETESERTRNKEVAKNWFAYFGYLKSTPLEDTKQIVNLLPFLNKLRHPFDKTHDNNDMPLHPRSEQELFSLLSPLISVVFFSCLSLM